MKKMCAIRRTGFALFRVILLLVSIGSTAPAAEKIVIGFSQATMNSTWRVAMLEENKKYAAEHYPDVDLIVTVFIIFFVLLVPETKGVSLEKIEANLLSGDPLRHIGQPPRARTTVGLPVRSAGAH
jgi:hypothetical protein